MSLSQNAMRLIKLALAATLAIAPLAAQAQAPAADAMPHKTIAPTTSITIVANGKSTTLTLAQIAALPHKTISVHNAHAQKDESYSGVSLADLLTANGAPFNKTTQHAMLNSYIVVKGTDNYTVLYSTVEVYTPDYHSGDAILADTRDGKPEEVGLQLVNTEDKHPMRWLHAPTTITLVNTQ